MQSQQKRVKWSRGETAEALEERTDTGITMASVELMENCIPDMYGNISRRPGLKCLPYSSSYWVNATSFGFQYDKYLQVFPFYITETDYILVGVHFTGITELIRVTNGQIVYYSTVSAASGVYPRTGVELGLIAGVYSYRPVSFAQQNNYMVIADGYNVWKLWFTFSSTDDYSFTPHLETWKFSAGWYAPNGTQTKTVNNSILANLYFSGHFYNYAYTDPSGISTVYSNTDTGIDGANNITTIEAEIPIGSIVRLPNIGCHFRIEGYYTEDDNLYFSNVTFDGVVNPNGQIPSSGVYCTVGDRSKTLKHYSNGVLVNTVTVNVSSGKFVTVRCSQSQTGYSKISYDDSFLHIVTWGNWIDADQVDSSIRAFGSLLTPVSDENAHDSVVSVEYGYTSLQPAEWSVGANYPHPKKLVFNEQRLWAGAWAYSKKEEYAITLGSQIARYNDFKNDYNQENEPITLDILTQYKERILHLIDYNGLKIMTDSFEYSYESGGAVKQSANGSWEYCEPIVFDSLCLYIDSTGCQVKAMQYEFQNNIYNSTTINQLTPHDLVWYPYSMAAYEDKINSTGKYLFVVNREDANTRLTVCNFVPGNQANIWNRWAFPTIKLSSYAENSASLLHSVVNLKNGTMFMLTINGSSGITGDAFVVPAVIDFNANTDAENSIQTIDNVNYYCPLYRNTSKKTTVANTQVAIYADGVFQFMDTTTSTGALTKSIAGLTNVTVGLPINSTIRSHPIDVGGKTKSIKKRIAKARMSVRDTEPGMLTINGKTGYMNPAKDLIDFYGVTGMKDEIKYTITNNQGAMFHLESLLMNIEYGTLIS